MVKRTIPYLMHMWDIRKYEYQEHQSSQHHDEKPKTIHCIITFDFKGLYNPIEEIKPNGKGYWEYVDDTVWKWYAYSPMDSLFEGKFSLN